MGWIYLVRCKRFVSFDLQFRVAAYWDELVGYVVLLEEG